MNFNDCDFSLPQARIARRPRQPRDSAYLLNCLSGGAHEGGREGACEGVHEAACEGDAAAFSSLRASDLRVSDLRVSDLPSLLRAGDIIVLNDTKVLPVRLRAIYRAGGSDGNSSESKATTKLTPDATPLTVTPLTATPLTVTTLTVTLAERIDDVRWHALVRGARKLKCGARLEFIDSVGRVVFAADIEARDASGMLSLRFSEQLAGEKLYDLLEGKVASQKGGAEGVIGSMPLPPYLKRAADERDLHDYQTLFARKRGAIAAPTAGRHITPSLLAALRDMGVASSFITLHVGIGSFKLLRVPKIESHRMASERVEITAATFAQIAQCRAQGGRVLAVGTTVVRALESAALQFGYDSGSADSGSADSGSADSGSADSGSAGDGSAGGYSGSTSLYITPGFRFRVVDLLLTNFHQARATPLILTCAFAGVACVAAAYKQARADARYRFFSYGDACLFTRGLENAGKM